MLYNAARFILNPVLKFLYRIEVCGAEKIPRDKSLIFAANHKSLLDPLFVGLFVPRTVCYMAKKELFENKFMRWLLKNLNVFPVDRKKLDISTLKTVLKILNKKGCIGIFPQGTRVLDENLGKAKSGTAMFAIKGKSEIIPVSIISEYRLFKKTIIYIDNPISFKEYYDKKITSEEYEELSQRVLDTIQKNMYKKGDN